MAEFFMIRPHGPNCWIGLGALRERVRLQIKYGHCVSRRLTSVPVSTQSCLFICPQKCSFYVKPLHKCFSFLTRWAKTVKTIMCILNECFVPNASCTSQINYQTNCFHSLCPKMADSCQTSATTLPFPDKAQQFQLFFYPCHSLLLGSGLPTPPPPPPLPSQPPPGSVLPGRAPNSP